MTQPTQSRLSPFDIETMIAGEDDHKQRAYLIILNSINNSLQANTETTRDISKKLDAHLTNFEVQTANNNEMLNKGRGAWKVLAWVLGIVQVIGLGIWFRANDDIIKIHDAITAGQAADARIEARQLSFERSILALEKKP